MRAAVPALLVALLAFVAAPANDPAPAKAGPALEVAPPPHDKPDPARDLKLVATSDGKPVQAGTDPAITLTLVNTSKDITYRVVKPGDGSEVGAREPHVYFTAEQLSVQGKWEPLPIYGRGRCGLFDWKWEKDVVELKPGGKLVVTNEWVPAPNLRLQQPGKVRVTGHYEYRAGMPRAGGVQRPVEERGGMGETPAFALASEPVEFDVVRPLDLRVKVKRPLKVGLPRRISDVLELTLTNTTSQPLTAHSGGSALSRVGLCGGGPEAENPQLTEFASKYGSPVTLKPGQTASLLGAGELANGADGLWTGRKPGKYLVRIEYAVESRLDSSYQVIVETIAEVPVEE